MAVHPMGARFCGEIIAAAFTRFQQRGGHAGNTVLHIGRDLAMPVNQRFHIQCVGQIDSEPLTGVEDQSSAAGAIDKAKDGGGATIDVQGALRGTQGQGCALGISKARKGGCGGECSRGCKKAAAVKKLGHVVLRSPLWARGWEKPQCGAVSDEAD
jgi:hypothetical protein